MLWALMAQASGERLVIVLHSNVWLTCWTIAFLRVPWDMPPFVVYMFFYPNECMFCICFDAYLMVDGFMGASPVPHRRLDVMWRHLLGSVPHEEGRWRHCTEVAGAGQRYIRCRCRPAGRGVCRRLPRGRGGGVSLDDGHHGHEVNPDGRQPDTVQRGPERRRVGGEGPCIGVAGVVPL